VYVNTLLFVAVILNGNFMGFMFEKHRNLQNVVVIMILIAGLNQRVYGYENVSDHLGKMCINSFGFLVALPLYMYCN